MASDTDRIIHVIEASKDELKAVLSDHEKRIQRLEVAKAVQVWQLSAIVAVMMAFGNIMWSVIKDHFGWKQ